MTLKELLDTTPLVGELFEPELLLLLVVGAVVLEVAVHGQLYAAAVATGYERPLAVAVVMLVALGQQRSPTPQDGTVRLH